MARDCQRSKCAEVSAITKRDQTKWDNDKQDSFFMDMPAKEE